MLAFDMTLDVREVAAAPRTDPGSDAIPEPCHVSLERPRRPLGHARLILGVNSTGFFTAKLST